MATLKQRLAFNKMIENGGNISAAMREAGYSAAMAHNPQKLINSKAWQELSNEQLSDEFLLKQVRALIDSDDNVAILKGLDIAIRLKGWYSRKPELFRDPYEDWTDEDLDAAIKQAEDERQLRLQRTTT